MLRKLWPFLCCGWILGCSNLGEGDGIRQADQFAQQKQYTLLAEMLENPLEPVRTRALHHMIHAISPQAHQHMERFLLAASELWRREALVMLFSSGRQDPHADALFARFCQDPDGEIRIATLAELGHRRTLTKTLWRCLLDGLGDANLALARIAHLGLRRHGWRSLPRLQLALIQSKSPLTERIVKLLIEITVQHWTQPKRWKAWFQSGQAALFALRYQGQWSQHKALIKRTLATGTPKMQEEAARLLARLAPTDKGLQLLLASPKSSTHRWITLWGQAGARHLEALFTTQPTKITPRHIRAFSAWVTPVNQPLLVPFLDPKRPRHCLATLEVLTRSLGLHHMASPQLIQRLQTLAHTPHTPPALAQASIVALWHAGIDLPQKTPFALKQAYTKAPLDQKQRALDALARRIAWFQDANTTRWLIEQIPRSPEHIQMDLLSALAYIGHFVSVEAAATHAFALGSQKPHSMGVSAYRLLHTLPPQKRYAWLLLLATKMAIPQWEHMLQSLCQRKTLGTEKTVIAQLLVRAMDNAMPWGIRKIAARVVAKHQVTTVLPRLVQLLHQAKSPDILPLARAIEDLRLAKALPALQRHFRQTKDKDLQWALALARWRCGDKQALAWAQEQLRRSKSHAWHVPRRFVRYLLQAQQTGLLLTYAPQLQHLFSTPLAALQATQTPRQETALRLAQQFQRRLEPKRDKQFAISWLRQHPSAQLYKSFQRIAPALEAKGLLPSTAQLLAQLARPHNTKGTKGTKVAQKPEETALATLGLMRKDKRLNARSRRLLDTLCNNLLPAKPPTPRQAQERHKHRIAATQQTLQQRPQRPTPRELLAIGNAHALLGQRPAAFRAYLMALQRSHNIRQQRLISLAMFRLSHQPTSQPANQPTSQPTSQKAHTP